MVKKVHFLFLYTTSILSSLNIYNLVVCATRKGPLWTQHKCLFLRCGRHVHSFKCQVPSQMTSDRRSVYLTINVFQLPITLEEPQSQIKIYRIKSSCIKPLSSREAGNHHVWAYWRHVTPVYIIHHYHTDSTHSSWVWIGFESRVWAGFENRWARWRAGLKGVQVV